MTVKKTGTETHIIKETTPSSRQYEEGHFGQLSDSFDLDSESLMDVWPRAEQEFSIDSAKIVEVNRRIVSGEYSVSVRRVAEKLLDLESQLRVMDGQSPEK
ncbi:MAG: hypothetical protein CMQ45_04295 [Gammaproteobacteria bacterium]|nr:hypothetical protein [Gammaproteobacteria bacterium]|tara:strand:- start:39 stop:341 length:303 start_codon:yes stop_codon:yes gene_type:complete